MLIRSTFCFCGIWSLLLLLYIATYIDNPRETEKNESILKHIINKLVSLQKRHLCIRRGTVFFPR